jgi:hypothetical protein
LVRSICVLVLLTVDLSQSILTVAFFLAAFLLGTLLDFLMLFNLVFSYLWIVVFAFAASWFSEVGTRQAHAVEAFSFLALYV